MEFATVCQQHCETAACHTIKRRLKTCLSAARTPRCCGVFASLTQLLRPTYLLKHTQQFKGLLSGTTWVDGTRRNIYPLTPIHTYLLTFLLRDIQYHAQSGICLYCTQRRITAWPMRNTVQNVQMCSVIRVVNASIQDWAENLH